MRALGVAGRVLTAAGASVVLIGGSMASAGAASSPPPWQVVSTTGAAEGVWSTQFAVSGPHNAWSTWAACGPCNPNPTNFFLVEHSTGTTWSQVTLTKSQLAIAQNSVALGTSSSQNVWFFDPKAKPTSKTIKALHLVGKTWQSVSLPSWVTHSNLSGTYQVQAEIFGPHSAWVFSEGQDAFTNADHYAARLTSHGWVKSQLPAIPGQVSVVSATDMWVLGYTVPTKRKPTARTVLMHWNGKHWHMLSPPKLHVPAHATEFLDGPAGVGQRDAWLTVEIERGSAGATTLYLLHWNGKHWSRVDVPSHISGVGYMVQDGHGGLWMTANGPKPSFTWYLLHLNAGKWTKDSVPSPTGTTVGDLIGLNWVPGTKSVWTYGNMFGPGTDGPIYGAILKHAG
jgi:hypothetical protein